MLDISFKRQDQCEYDMENIMQKALTPVNTSENDCFPDDAVEEVEEADTPLSPVSIGERPLAALCNLRFADHIDLLGSAEEKL